MAGEEQSKLLEKTIKGRRDQVYIFTKCGTLPDGKDGWSENLKPESIRKELKESLQRLQTYYVDLYSSTTRIPGHRSRNPGQRCRAQSTKAKSDMEDYQTIP